jgi:hypothetical protein
VGKGISVPGCSVSWPIYEMLETPYQEFIDLFGSNESYQYLAFHNLWFGSMHARKQIKYSAQVTVIHY